MILNSPNDLHYIPQRIISLVPSQTELLYYLGLQDETIAITKFCVHPTEWFRSKTRIGGTKSLKIDKIMELAPDLIIANNEENVKEQIETLAEQFPLWVTDVNGLDSALNMIGDIGVLTGKITDAGNLRSKIQNEFEVLDLTIAALNARALNTAYLIWKDPYMTVGGDTFISNMMQRCGWKNIFAGSKRYPETGVQQLKEMNCELLLLSSEPFPFSEKHITELKERLPGMQILLVDGEMFSWYGSRLLLSPAYFKQIVDETVKQHSSQN